MKKILAPLVMLLVATAIAYSIKLNGFDIVNALGTLMIITAMAITYRILMAKPKKRKEFS
jgi:Kef-type K+ transport system membrane component KefB